MNCPYVLDMCILLSYNVVFSMVGLTFSRTVDIRITLNCFIGGPGGSTEGGSLAPAGDGGHEGVAGKPGVSDQCGERGPRGELPGVVLVELGGAGGGASGSGTGGTPVGGGVVVVVMVMVMVALSSVLL